VTVALAMIARDEEAVIGRALDSAATLVDELVVFDTGSTDGTRDVAAAKGARVVDGPWEGFAAARTAALALTRDHDWTLMLDADQTIVAHPGLRTWLDKQDDVDAYMVAMVEGDLTFRMPRLTRGGIDWTYRGRTHEWLVGEYRHRPLLGLTIRHHHDGGNRADKHARDLELLADDVARNDPRAVYYSAQALWGLGRTDEAVAMYLRRAGMVDTWEEERWHAQYMAARLSEDIDALFAAYRRRPHRPEPLVHAARIVRERGTEDVLFLEAASAPPTDTAGSSA